MVNSFRVCRFDLGDCYEKHLECDYSEPECDDTVGREIRLREHGASAHVDIQSTKITDHDGEFIHMAWNASKCEREKLAPFPYQVYFTQGAHTTSLEPESQIAFVNFLEQMGGVADPQCQYRFDFYSRPFVNVLECMVHQRKELEHRKRSGSWPRLVPVWKSALRRGYPCRILVLDSDNWEEDGVLLVNFEAADCDPVQAIIKDKKELETADLGLSEAVRVRDFGALLGFLKSWWSDAGGQWTQADLARKNDGGVSPALYPAMDPSAHLDVADDGLAVEIDDIDPAGIVLNFFNHGNKLTALRTQSYSDEFGLSVDTVWDPLRSKRRPNFSLTLYLPVESLPIRLEALFDALDRGLLSSVPWALDVVRDVPSLETALRYHERAALPRAPESVQRKERDVQATLTRVIGNTLPSELVAYIERLILPPALPDYSQRPYRPFRSFFLYLDPASLQLGPYSVYSDPVRPQKELPPPVENEERQDTLSAPWKDSCLENTVLRVRAKHWSRITEEIHTLWTLCTPSCILPPEKDLPTVALEMTFDRNDFGHPGNVFVGYSTAELRFHLQSSEPIAVQNRFLFTHNLWMEVIDLIDVETGMRLPPQPHRVGYDEEEFDGWGFHLRQDYRSDSSTDDVFRPSLWTLYPGASPFRDTVGPEETWWEVYDWGGLLKVGKQYDIKLRPGITIPRWTYGTRNDLKGPYNLPPIPVTMEPIRIRYQSTQQPEGLDGSGTGEWDPSED